MKRELRFRAYSNETQKMMDWDFIKSVNNLNKLITLNHVDVMQFTGLSDGNGKHIYEGDILREPAKDEWEKLNYSCFEVFFHDGNENVDYNIGFTMQRMHNHGAICGGYVPSFKPKNTSKMIVIGNIYENASLLLKSVGKV